MSTNTQHTVGIQEDDGTFQRKTFAEIERDILARAREEMGEAVDLSQGSPIKQLLDAVIYEHERTWKVLEDLYYSSYYDDAYGQQLDKLLSLAAMNRIPRRAATGEVSFSVNVANTADVVIERGTIVEAAPTENRPAIPFRTTEVAVLEAGDAAVHGVGIRALDPWDDETSLDADWLGAKTNLPANTIEQFRTQVPGVDAVTNPNPTGDTNIAAGYDYVEGRDRESDAEFRERYETTLGENGAASLNNIRASVKALPGVETAAIEENTSMDDHRSSGGLPPKSVRVTALTTEPNYHDEIARAIGESRSGGIQAYGSESGTWVSDDDVERTEGFDLATEQLVYVQADVTHDSTFPSDGNKRVERAILQYIGGTTTAGDQYDGTEMTEDVIYDLVYKAAMSVQGVWRADVTIGTSDPPSSKTSITIGDFEVATTAPGAISVGAIRQDRP